MKVTPILLSMAVALSACATSSTPLGGARAAQPANCQLIAAIAKEQYGYNETMTLLLNSDGYVPRCDWEALGLEVEVVDVDRLDSLAPWLSFVRPRRSGGQRVVDVTHWWGVHVSERSCHLRLEGGEWRLAEACALTWSL